MSYFENAIKSCEQELSSEIKRIALLFAPVLLPLIMGVSLALAILIPKLFLQLSLWWEVPIGVVTWIVAVIVLSTIGALVETLFVIKPINRCTQQVRGLRERQRIQYIEELFMEFNALVAYEMDTRLKELIGTDAVQRLDQEAMG